MSDIACPTGPRCEDYDCRLRHDGRGRNLEREDAARARLEVEVAKLRKVAEAARAVLEAVDACDREAERHPSSRSSAPMVRYIGAMKRLQAALDAKKET